MTDLKTFAARFNHALDQLPSESRPPDKGSGRQLFVAKMFHISQKGARKWLEGEALPRTSRLGLIASRCGVNGEWLLTGQGAMRPDTPADRQRLGTAETMSPYRAASVETRRLIAKLVEADIEGQLLPADIAALDGMVLRLVARGRNA